MGQFKEKSPLIFWQSLIDMNYLKFLFLNFVSFYCLSGCTNLARPKPFSQLQIIIDKDLDDNFMNRKLILYKDSYYLNNSLVDTIKYRDSIYCKKLINGEYAIKISTKFNTNHLIKFFLKEDTIININDKMALEKVSLFTYKELYDADTIDVIKEYFGCFDHRLERLKIYNVGYRSYAISYELRRRSFPDTVEKFSKEVKYASISVLNKLFYTQLQANNLLDTLKQKGARCWSTGTEYFYIRIKDKSFQFTDEGTCNWSLYNNLKQKFVYDS